MSRGRTQSVLTTRFADGASHRRPDDLIVEEPLEIHLDGTLVATTMRTPGHDFELAAGFCYTEGLLAGATVQTCRYCGTGSAVDTEFNIVSVDTAGQAPAPTPRVGTTSSSCGLCGSTSIDELTERLQPLVAPTRFDLGLLAEVPERARAEQPLRGHRRGACGGHLRCRGHHRRGARRHRSPQRGRRQPVTASLLAWRSYCGSR